MMKLVKALGALALSGVAVGTTQLAAAETTTPIQDLVIVEETASPDLDDARIIAPYGVYGYQPYGGFGYRPYGGFGYRPYGGFGYRPYGGFGYRPYGGFGYRPGFQPFGWYQPWRSRSSGVEAAPGGDVPTPEVNLPDDR
ncbi:hypothetical protein BE04_11795 [Sorangium cellulosum]|uniref:Secreted protein n=1 Tax=Sorangium cellulosum TaxID=56 RepID=A0A150PPY0_SORCE|nr:hypothetical protein BE04_11795 [Sorangium cellulosum]